MHLNQNLSKENLNPTQLETNILNVNLGEEFRRLKYKTQSAKHRLKSSMNTQSRTSDAIEICKNIALCIPFLAFATVNSVMGNVYPEDMPQQKKANFTASVQACLLAVLPTIYAFNRIYESYQHSKLKEFTEKHDKVLSAMSNVLEAYSDEETNQEEKTFYTEVRDFFVTTQKSLNEAKGHMFDRDGFVKHLEQLQTLIADMKGITLQEFKRDINKEIDIISPNNKKFLRIMA